MEEDDDDDRNTKRPSEIYVNTNTYNSLDGNGHGHGNDNDNDEESVASIIATDTTFLLNKRTDSNSDMDAADIETNYTRSSHTNSHKKKKKKKQYTITNDNGKEMNGILELKNAIQRKPCLSAYIMFSTLFFGFAVGFSTGFLASEKKLFDSFTTTTSASTYDNDTIQMSNDKMEKTADTLSKFIENDAIFQDMSSQTTENHQYQQQQQQQQPPQQEERQSPLLRFPFQTGTSKPRPLIYLNRQDAETLLVDGVSASMSCTMSSYTGDFFLISSGLDAQINQDYCGVATAAAILNSLRFYKSEGFDVPIDPVYAPYTYATQRDIFNECTEKHVVRHSTSGGTDIDGVLSPPYGMSVSQIANMLRCSLNTTTDSGIGWDVQEQYVDSSHVTAAKMRYDMKKALVDTNSRVLVNYDRSAVGQEGGGHWSPVGSYSEKRDAFLIMDVAKYKYPPVWIPSERLFDGLATYDNCGSWNFPDAQDLLSQEERSSTPGDANYASIMNKLGCEKKLRGYITVTRISTP
jgi:hypothetical protein